jgi:predicted secreted protein
MITFLFRKLSFGALLVMIIACNAKSGGANTSQKGSPDTIRVKGCQGGLVKAKVGHVLELQLEAVPGSGYQWLLKDSSKLLMLLDKDNLKFTSPQTNEPTPGAPGHQILHFEVMKEGTESLRLEYKRTWESEVTNSCDMKIEVTKT